MTQEPSLEDYYATLARDTAVKKASLYSLYFFSKNILGYNLLNEDNKQWCEDANEIKRVLSIPKGKITKDITRFMKLYPRETYKSTLFTVSLSLWLLANFPNLSILISSKAQNRAGSFLQEIKNHCEKNDKFKYYFGNWRGDIWQNSYVVISKRKDVGIKEPSILTAGMDTTLTSIHVDIAILDDIVGVEDRDSAAERQSSKNYFKDMDDLVRRGGVTLVVGTHWHFDDAYKEIKEENEKKQFWDIKSESCWDEDHNPNFLVFTKEFLEDKLLRKGSVFFSANYENEPISSESTLFAMDKMVWFEMEDMNWKQMPAYGYNDPALGKNKSGCFAPIITAKIDYSGKYPILYIVDADVNRRSASNIVDTVQLKHEMFSYDRFRMESVGMQDFLREKTEDRSYEIARSRMKKEDLEDGEKLLNEASLVGLPVEPDSSLKGSKESRIEEIEYPITAGYIRFRKDWKTAPGNYRELIDQLTQYPVHKYKDGPDCLAGLWRMTKITAGVY